MSTHIFIINITKHLLFFLNLLRNSPSRKQQNHIMFLCYLDNSNILTVARGCAVLYNLGFFGSEVAYESVWRFEKRHFWVLSWFTDSYGLGSEWLKVWDAEMLRLGWEQFLSCHIINNYLILLCSHNVNSICFSLFPICHRKNQLSGYNTPALGNKLSNDIVSLNK